MPADGIYWWRVRAENADGYIWSPENWCFRVDTLAPAAPSPIAPDDDENTDNTNPTFRWTEPSENSTPLTYHIWIDNNSDFASPENDNSGLTDNQFNPGFLQDGKWYWRVGATDNAGNTGENSDTRWVRVDTVAPAAPSLPSPENNENVNDNTPNLSWSTVSENSLPVLYYAAVSDNLEFPYENENSDWIDDDNYQLTTELTDGNWYWHVRAKDNAGNIGNISENWIFRVDKLMPELLSPADGENTNDNRPTFSWENMVVADNYELQIDNEDTFSAPLIYDNDIITDNQHELPADNALSDGVYYWRVLGYKNGDNSISSVRSFRVDTVAPEALMTNVGAEPDPLIDGDNRIGSTASSYADARVQDGTCENIQENGPITQDDNVTSYDNTRGLVLNFDNMRSAADGGAYATLRESADPIWIQTTWAGGPTKPTYENGQWTSTYDNFYENENVNTAGAELKLSGEGGAATWDTLTPWSANLGVGQNNGHRIEAMGDYVYAWVAYGGTVGGTTGSGQTAFYRYDPSGPTWETDWNGSYSETAPFGSSYGIGMIRAKDPAGNPAIYIMGGTTSNGSQRWARWTEAGGWNNTISTSIPWDGSASQTKPRNGSAFAWDGNDTIYYFPGSGYSYTQYDWYKYTISTDTWSYVGETPHKQGPGNAAVIATVGADQYIFIQFGLTPSGSYTAAKFYKYGPLPSGSWTELTKHAYGADDGSDLVWGGADTLYHSPGAYGETAQALTSADESRFLSYSISGNSWTALTAQPNDGGSGNGSDDAGASAKVGSYIYRLKGGSGNGGTMNKEFFRYGPIAGGYELDGYVDSSIFDAGQTVDWGVVTWNENRPAGTAIKVSLRSGDTSTPDASWSSWCYHDNDTENTSLPDNRYVQYRVELTTDNNSKTPELYDITINGYSMNIDVTITGTPPEASPYVLQLRYRVIIQENDTFRVQVYDNAGGTWNYCGDNLTADNWTDWSYTLASDERAPNGDVKAKFVDNKPGATNPADLQLDYLRVRSIVGDIGYALRWEHRIENVVTGHDNYWVRVRGYTSGDSENVGVYIWNDNAGNWEFIDNLPVGAENVTTIESHIPGDNIENYLVGDNLSIKYEDYDNTDDTQTTVHIDYCALELVSPALSPPHGASTENDAPTFVWDTITDPSGVTYTLQIDNEPSFDNAYYVYHNTDIPDNTYTLPPENALGDGTHYWRVRAIDGAGNIGGWSPVWQFTVTDIDAPEAPMMNAVGAEPDPLIDGDNRIGGNAGSYADARAQDDNYENIQENNLGSLSYQYVQSENVYEGGTENFDNAQADDGNYENFYENDYGTPGFDNYAYVSSYDNIKGTVTNFAAENDNDDGDAYATLSEAGTVGGENNNVDSEPDTLVDSSTRIGILLGGTSYLQAQTQDGVYENIRENNTFSYTYVTSWDNIMGTLTDGARQKADNDDNATLAEGENIIGGGTWTKYATTSGGDWTNPANVEGSPDTTYATAVLANELDVYGGGYATELGSITNITIKTTYHVDVAVKKDKLKLYYTVSSVEGTTNYEWEPADTSDTEVTLDVSGDRSWTWDDISNLQVHLNGIDAGGPAETITASCDALYVTITVSSTTTYSMEIDENIDSVPSADNYKLQLEYKLANTEDQFRVQVYNGSGWENVGENLDNTSAETWENSIPSSWVINSRVRVKFVDVDSSSTSQDNIYIDYLRVRAENLDYRLNWEHRITGVDNTYENYKVIIYGYTDNLDENVGVYVWDNANSTWLFIDNLPTTPGASIDNTVHTSYFVNDNLSLRYFENTDDTTATTVHIDYCALEGICTTCSIEINENIDNVVTGPSNTYVLQIYFQLDNQNENFRVQVENSTGGWENFDNLLTYQDAVWTTWENAINSDKVSSDNIVRLKFVDNNPDATSATDLWIDYLRVKSTTPTTIAYRENIQHDITGIPAGYESYTLEIEYYVAGDANENIMIYLENFSSGSWNYIDNLGSTTLDNFTYDLTGTDFFDNDNVHVRYVQPDNDSTGTDLVIDYCRVKAENIKYALRWEHRIENVTTGHDNYWVRVLGYTSGDSENVGVYIWENQSGTWAWGLIDNLTTAEKTIEKYIVGENIENYLVGDNLSIMYLSADNTDDNQTTVHIDYFALEWASAALSPPHGAHTEDNTPTFVWDAVTDPSGVIYTLQIDNENTFSAPLVFENTGIPDNTYTLPVENGLADDDYYWRVRAVDGAANTGGWSPVWQFSYGDIAAPSAPISLSASPSSWTSTNSFSVSWTNPADNSGIAGAYYKLDSVPTSSADGTYTSGSGITSISGIAVSGDGLHAIYVWLKDGSGNVDHANRASTNLYLWTDTTAPAAPTNLSASPSGWTKTNSFSVSWTNPSGDPGIAGAYYKLDSVPTSSADGTYTSGSGITLISGISVSGDGLHAIYVWLKDKVGNVDHANRNSTAFKLDTSAPSAPSLSAPTAPSDNAATNDNTPTLDWDSVTGAVKYTLQYATDNAFAENLTTVDDITDENYPIPSPGLADNTWYWRVEAIDEATNASAWSSTWSFIVDTAQPENAPVLLSPENNTTEATGTPTFRWTTVTDALSGLASYTLVVDNELSFDSPYVIEETGLTENTYALPTSEALDDGTYYWRVRAIDNAGNGIWSDNFKLVIHAVLPPPELESPASGSATRDNTPKFEWSVAENAENYDLEYSTASDLSADVTSITTDNNWYQVPDENALSENTWYWRVRARDNTGKVSNWSSTWSLIISEAPVYVVEVSIWPDNQTGTPGTTLPHYIVTVQNIGNAEDSYTLEVADSAGWELDLQKTSVTIDADESEEVRLMVTISDDATDGDVDTITVTVTSENDNTVSDSATCKTIARLRVVEFTFTFEFGAENGVANFEDENIPVYLVTIIVENVTDGVKGTVIVMVLENIVGPAPPGMVHRYVKIEPSIVNAGIKGLLARFRVSKSWVRQNNIDKGTIKVFEMVENEWLELPTSFVDEDSAYLYYEAEGLGFSLYAVTGQEAGAPMIWVLGGVVVILAVVLAIWIRGRYYGPGVRIRIVFKTGLCELPPFKKGCFWGRKLNGATEFTGWRCPSYG